MPSHHELMAVVGLRSNHLASTCIEHVIEHDGPDQDTVGTLMRGGCFFDLWLLGTVEAGFPSPAEEELKDIISLDEYLIRNKEATYLLLVSGVSMIEAGILPGDLLVVERGAAPWDGAIVVAQVDGEWTIKYFRRRGGKVFLEAANKDYRPIHPTEELKIAAVVRGVVRRYA